MELTLNDRIKEAIKNDLPAMVGQELQTFIQQAQANEAELKTTKERLESTQRESEVRRMQLVRHGDIDKRIEALNEERKKLQEAQLALRGAQADLRAQVAEAKFETFSLAVNKFLKLPSVRNNVVAEVGKPVEGCPGGGPYNTSPTPGMIHQTTDKTTTVTTHE